MLIARISRGKCNSFAGAARYDMEKDKAQFLSTNCASSDWRGISKEMDAMAASSSSKNPVHHVSISSTERLSPEDWEGIKTRYMAKMGMTHLQYSASIHNDSDHQHLHLLVNKIDSQGKCWSPWQDAKRARVAMLECEKVMGLTRFEDHITQDTGRMTKLQSDLRDSIKEAHIYDKSHEALQQALNKRGYDLKLHSNSGGVYGASIQAHSDKKTWKLFEVQKGGFKGVEKQLVNGVPETTKSDKPKISAGISPMATSMPSESSCHASGAGGHRSLEGVADKDLRDLIIRINADSGGIMQANLKGRGQEL